MKTKFNFPKHYVFLYLIILFFLADSIISGRFWEIFQNTTDWMGLVYQDMWNNLLTFHLTLDTQYTTGEAIIINGKHYLYYMPFPALIRGFLGIFELSGSAELSQITAIVLFAVSSIAFYMQLLTSLKVKIPQNVMFASIALLIICTPALSMLVHISYYWEAIIWANAMLMTACYLSFSLFIKPGIFRIFGFSLICGLTLFTRPPEAFAVTILFFLTIIPLSINRLNNKFIVHPATSNYKKKYLVISTLIFTIFLILLGGMNYAKWGNPLQFAPMDKNVQFMGNGGERAKHFLKYGSLRIDRIPQTISYYFLVSSDNYQKEPPFIKIGNHNYFQGFTDSFDIYNERTLPLPVVFPLIFLMAIYGIFKLIQDSIFKREKQKILFLWPSVIATSICTLCICMIITMAIRYRGDILPLMSLCYIYGIISLQNSIYTIFESSTKGKILNKDFLIISLIIFLGLISLYFMTESILLERAMH